MNSTTYTYQNPDGTSSQEFDNLKDLYLDYVSKSVARETYWKHFKDLLISGEMPVFFRKTDGSVEQLHPLIKA